MKQFTVILRRSSLLMDILDDDDDLYIANSTKRFENVQEAGKAAKLEAAKADRVNVYSTLQERGMHAGVFNTFHIDPDNYEVIMVFAGRPKLIASSPTDLAIIAVNRNF